jgi:hypothetical protein
MGNDNLPILGGKSCERLGHGSSLFLSDGFILGAHRLPQVDEFVGVPLLNVLGPGK